MRVAVLCGLLVVVDIARAEGILEADTEMAKRSGFDAARRCTLIKADAERLACFDGVYAGESVTAGVEVDAPPPVELTASPEEYSDKKVRRTRNDRVESTIVDIATNAHNIDFLTLENGHIWRENEDSRVRFRKGTSVTIEEGMFGSFNLTMEGAPKSVKVKRVE